MSVGRSAPPGMLPVWTISPGSTNANCSDFALQTMVESRGAPWGPPLGFSLGVLPGVPPWNLRLSREQAFLDSWLGWSSWGTQQTRLHRNTHRICSNVPRLLGPGQRPSCLVMRASGKRGEPGNPGQQDRAKGRHMGSAGQSVCSGCLAGSRLRWHLCGL